MTTLDRWLVRVACIMLIALGLYVYGVLIVDQAVFRRDVVQAINNLVQARQPAGAPAPVPGPVAK